MTMNSEALEATRKALNNPRYTWRTVAGICKETGLPPETVIEAFGALPDLVTSVRYRVTRLVGLQGRLPPVSTTSLSVPRRATDD